MIALVIIGSLVGYAFAAGVVYEFSPARWDGGNDITRPPRELVAAFWPLLAVWAPLKLLGVVFRTPAAMRRAIASRRANKALPEARVL